MRRITGNSGVLVILLCLVTPAWAHPEDAPEEAEEARPAWPPVFGPYRRRLPPEKDEGRVDHIYRGKPSARRHDGFYFRFAGGIGSGSDSMEAPNVRTNTSREPFSGKGSGVSAATEVAMGAALVPGLIVGGAIETATLTAMETDRVATIGQSYEFKLSQLALFNLHLDVYPFPRSGLHGQAGFGFATLVMGQGFPKGAGPDTRAHTATGLGLMAGVGHEWWVAEQWGIGGLARVLYAWSDGSDVEGVAWGHKTLAITLMLTATYN